MESILGESNTLLNAQLSFLDTHLALIRIHTTAYVHFVQAILRIILHNDRIDEDGELFVPHRPWMHWHPFVNISLTPQECTILCPRHQADAWFVPVKETLAEPMCKFVSISKEDYSVITIGGPGMDAGARVVDLSSPLAVAGIPIFFITSYYSDFLIVPYSARTRVIRALEGRGFVFEKDQPNGEAGHMMNPASPMTPHGHDWKPFPSPILDSPPNRSTVPSPSIPELQANTLELLRRYDIVKSFDRRTTLVTCGGYKDVTSSTSAANFTQGKLLLGLTKCLTSSLPIFLSLTLTDTESLSVTLEKRLTTAFFHNEGEDLLLGKDGPVQIPIIFDLGCMSVDSTGIVCGVASWLTEGMKKRAGMEAFNLSYLSTAEAGYVIVYEDELDDAVEVLEDACGRVIDASGSKKSSCCAE